MLTVDFRRFPVRPGQRVLDLGCGGGRHAFEVYRRGADVVAFDLDPAELAPVTGMFGAMQGAGEAIPQAGASAISGDATAMPFGDDTFDRVIAAEVLEHILDDQRAMNELARVLRPGGLACARDLSPPGRGRPMLTPHAEPSVEAIISCTPSRFSYTSILVTRTTWKPSELKICVLSASRANVFAFEWVGPSISTISLPAIVTKSTM